MRQEALLLFSIAVKTRGGGKLYRFKKERMGVSPTPILSAIWPFVVLHEGCTGHDILVVASGEWEALWR
jgi:hypothetical protein